MAKNALTRAPISGAVLGLDIGFSKTRASGAICRLEWDAHSLHWECKRFRYNAIERQEAICAIASGRDILAAAFDGPFRGDLTIIGKHRASDKILTDKIARFIGKPGVCNAPVGVALNTATNQAVADVLKIADVKLSSHRAPIHPSAVVEAFPNSFMGVMLPDGHGLNKGRAGKSDRYYLELSASGRLADLLSFLLPGRTLCAPLASVANHDDRAALICAMSALCIVVGGYVAVGDANGRIVLPPRDFWNKEIFDLVKANCEALPDPVSALIDTAALAARC